MQMCYFLYLIIYSNLQNNFNVFILPRHRGDRGKVDTFLHFQHIYGSFCAFLVINGSKFAEFHWLFICTNHLLLKIDHNYLQAKILRSLGCPLCPVQWGKVVSP